MQRTYSNLRAACRKGLAGLASALLLLAVPGLALAGTHGPCKVKELNQSDSNAAYLIVKLSCDGIDLPPCAESQKDSVAWEATTEIGKVRTSILLSALNSKKDVRISSYGMCPTELGNVPLMYGVTLY